MKVKIVTTNKLVQYAGKQVRFVEHTKWSAMLSVLMENEQCSIQVRQHLYSSQNNRISRTTWSISSSLMVGESTSYISHVVFFVRVRCVSCYVLCAVGSAQTCGRIRERQKCWDARYVLRETSKARAIPLVWSTERCSSRSFHEQSICTNISQVWKRVTTLARHVQN